MSEQLTVARRILSNFLSQGVGRLGNLVLNLIAMLALVRYLGADRYGSYIFIINFTTLFGLIGDFGISQVAVREISREPDKANSLLTMSAVLRFALSFLAMVLSLIAINSLESTTNERVGVLLASGIFLIQALSSFNSIFQVKLAMHYDALTQFAIRAVDTGLILFFITQGTELLPFLTTPLISGILGCLLIAIITARRFRVRLAWDASWIPMLLREAWPIGLASLPVILFFRADSLLLNRLAGNIATGIYAAAQRPVEYLLVIASPLLLNTVYPLLSSYWVADKARFNQLYRRAFDVQMGIIVIIATVAVVFSDHIIELLYTEKFADSALPLQLLFISAIFMFMGAYVARMLIAVNGQRKALFNESVGAVTNIGLNLWLIPLFGAAGSAVAMLVTVVIVSGLHLWAMQRAAFVLPRADMFFRIVAGGIVSGGLMWLIGQYNWWLGIACGLFAYPIILGLLGVFRVNEILSLIPRRMESQE